MLRTEPSFCIYNEDGDLTENDGLVKDGDKPERSATIGERIEAQFSFGRNAMRMIKEEDLDDEEDDEEIKRPWSRFRDLKIESEDESVNHPVYAGAEDGSGTEGIDGGGVESEPLNSDDSWDLEKSYKSMVGENPSDLLVLRNYAQYLESKGDLFGAEEYYRRAVFADPKDGEILYRYAKLVWQLHHDQERASTYFERAVQSAPEDSDVLAAYASFLWEIDEDVEEESSSNDQADQSIVGVEQKEMDFDEENRPATPPLHLALGPGVEPAFGFHGGVDAVASNESYAVEDYHQRMVEENPCNPFFLRDYAQFLHQSKGDLKGAEEYYSRAILANPSDGQIISLYASLLWQLYHDKDRAISYFERSVQAAPGDSNVLASYAKFLWEIEDGEEDIGEETHQIPLPQAAPTAAGV